MDDNTPHDLSVTEDNYHTELAIEHVEEDPVASDNESEHDDQSTASEEPVMEPFEEYRFKIAQLLNDIELPNFSIEAIQHGYGFMNCIYALTPTGDSTEQYILRVAFDTEHRESDGKCETVENEIVLLEYLKDKLPVPHIKAYCTTKNNVLEAAYTVQTRVEGQSLNHVWKDLDYTERRGIVDEYLKLVVKFESVTFSSAGSLSTSAPLPAAMDDFNTTAQPIVHFFDDTAPQNPTTDPHVIRDRTGSDIKALLTSHLEMLIQDEVDSDSHEFDFSSTPLYRQCLSMLSEMESEGYFADQPHPIVLHHCDLEPRNLMVARDADGAWKITGIIDWDDALALPRPLARKPPVWIWWYPDEEPDAEVFYDDDQHGYPEAELSDADRALKAYFDERVEELLPGYREDAYGRGKWMRRIWTFARAGAYSEYMRGFLEQVPKDWDARSKKGL